MTLLQKTIIALILLLAAFIRLVNLNQVPPGVYADTAAHGYNAYSLLKTGRDEYGKRFPVFLRSFGTYSSPLYAYLTVIPVAIFGLNAFSTNLVSALSGTLLCLITFLILYNPEQSQSFLKSTLATLVIALSPWSIFASRGAFEPNLGLFLLSVVILWLKKAVNSQHWLMSAAAIAGVSGYAYHAQRIVSPLLLFVFVITQRSLLRKKKSIVFLSLLILIIIQLPQLLLSNTKGANVRLRGQSYAGKILTSTYNQNPIINLSLRGYVLAREFTSQYTAYLSPRNLFFDPDPDRQRSIPELSVFYPWMIIFLFLGFKRFGESRDATRNILVITLLLGPIAGSLVSDPFSTLRALPVFWIISIAISLGIWDLLTKLKLVPAIVSGCALLIISASSIYSHYFVLLPSERAIDWGYGYQLLAREIKSRANTKFVIDTSRGQPPHMLLAFYLRYDPLKMQADYGPRVLDNYYNRVDFDRHYILGNIETRPINWEKDIYTEQVLVGDKLAISPTQATEHKLTKILEFKDKTGETLLVGYETNPGEKCKLPTSEPQCRVYSY